jgi:hypothetical protein
MSNWQGEYKNVCQLQRLAYTICQDISEAVAQLHSLARHLLGQGSTAVDAHNSQLGMYTWR